MPASSETAQHPSWNAYAAPYHEWEQFPPCVPTCERKGYEVLEKRPAVDGRCCFGKVRALDGSHSVLCHCDTFGLPELPPLWYVKGQREAAV